MAHEVLGKGFHQSSTFFHYYVKISDSLGNVSLIKKIWIPFNQICFVSKLSWNLSSVFGDIDKNMISTNADDNYVNDTQWHMTHKMSFKKVYLLKSATWSKNNQKQWIVCKEQQGKLLWWCVCPRECTEWAALQGESNTFQGKN